VHLATHRAPPALSQSTQALLASPPGPRVPRARYCCRGRFVRRIGYRRYIAQFPSGIAYASFCVVGASNYAEALWIATQIITGIFPAVSGGDAPGAARSAAPGRSPFTCVSDT
jgi:hypothetical protein